MSSFEDLAVVYNRFNQVEDYKDWLTFTREQVGEDFGKVLDVACGTGILTYLLSSNSSTITGLDISEKMLEEARELEFMADNMNFIQGDMLDMKSLDEDFDLVTCYLDSLCFLNDKVDICTAITQIYNRLKPGGIFLFDVWNKEQLPYIWGEFSYFDSDDTSAIMWDSYFDSENDILSHYLTVFVKREEDHLYKRLEVELTEKVYQLGAYLDILEEIGFSQVNVYLDADSTSYNKETSSNNERWFIKAVK